MEFFVITRDQKMLEEKHREELLKSANFESNSKRDHVLYLEDQSELRHTNRMRNMNNGNTFFLKIINKLKWVYVTITLPTKMMPTIIIPTKIMPTKIIPTRMIPT